MNVTIMDKTDVSWMDKVLLFDAPNLGPICRMVPALAIDHYRREHFQLWCHNWGVYQYPTQELIDFLKVLIGGRRAIEIGSGFSCLGRFLGIPMTDSYMHLEPEVKAMYALTKQPQTLPPPDVLKMDGNVAVAEFAPEVVIGSWITSFQHNGYGVDEFDILKRADYILVGNQGVHGSHLVKPIQSLPRREFRFSASRSRATRPEQDRIWMWRKQR